MTGLLFTSILCIAAPSHVVGIQQLMKQTSVQKLHGAMIDGSNATNFEENHPKEKCQAPGQLYFAHIMKDGGESVNDYLECLCDKHTCSVEHHEGPVHYRAGVHQSCEPSICTSHGMVDQKVQSCGSEFKKAPVFTVMRSPVSRIVSLYHFHKDLGHDFCTRNSLLQVLQIVEQKTKTNSRVDHEWSDAMVDWYFSNGEVISLVHGDESEKLATMPAGMNGTMQSATGKDLSQAKEILKGFQAIFFTDDLDTFPKLWAKSNLPFSHGWHETCELGRVGAGSNYPDPSHKELELIKSLNWADIELYEYAKSLPNQIS